jgi:hypothetical protein
LLPVIGFFMAQRARKSSAAQSAGTTTVQQHRQRGSARSSSANVLAVFPFWVAVALFTLATLLFFRAQLFGQAYFWEDFIEYVYPAQSFAARMLQSGTIPFWNPYTFSGLPFAADVAVGLWYPPNMMLALFVSDGRLSVLAVECLIIAHVWLAQVTMYGLVRSYGVSNLGSAIAALSYGFSGIVVCHTFHPMMVAHYAWFPLAFMLFRRALEQKGIAAVRSSLLAGMVLGVMMLSGHPQTTLYLLLWLLLYTLWHVGNGLYEHIPASALLRSGALAALPVLIGAGIFAIQLLHSQEFSSVSERNLLTVEKASIGSLQFKQLLTAFAPKLFGASDAASSTGAAGAVPFVLEGSEYYAFWETAFYCGVVALMLGLVGMVHTFRSCEHGRLGMFVLLTSLFAVLFALGNNGVVFPAMFQLPLFDRFRVPSRIVCYLTIGFTLLAGVGFDALAGASPKRWRIALTVVGGVLAVSFVLVLGGTALAETPKQFVAAVQSHLLVAFVFTLLAAAALLLAARGVLPPTIAGLACIVLVVIDLNVMLSSFNSGTTNPEDVYKLNPQLQFLLQPQQPDSLFRVQTRERGVMTMPRNQGLMTPVMMFEGYMPLTLERRNPITPSAETTLDLLNIRYAVRVDSASGRAYFAERPTAFPRARMLYKARETSTDSVKTLAASGEVDFAHEVLLERASPLALPNEPVPSVQHSVRCTEYTPNSMSYTVSTSKNGVLLLSEIWYPAWRVTIDGQPAEVLRANYSLRAVAVPQGTHVVRWVYNSQPFRIGAWISAATLVLVAAGYALTLRTSPSKASTA